jgi:hypothetical protein
MKTKSKRYDSSSDTPGDERICSNCIGESFLSNLVAENGKRRKCSYCGSTGKTISVEELADRTGAVFYQRTLDYPDDYQSAMLSDKESGYSWERDGDPVTDVIADVARISPEAAMDVQSILQERFSSRSSDEIGEETEFDEESYYVYVGVDSKAWEEKWDEFEKSLKTSNRYFNQFGKEYLDEVFKDLHQLKAIGGNPFLVGGPTLAFKTVYRARVFLSDDTLRTALTDVVEQLGPPLSSFAKSGRMNATGISVFYGATDEYTALAEVRPPVGSKVAVAKFHLIRDLRLLNLLELQGITVDGSLFNETYADLLSRVQFLSQLSKKMVVPVMPGKEDTQYLVTQAIADYLAMESTINVNGIIFPSIQTKTGSNVVLFHKASRVKKRDIPAGTEISVTLYEYGDDGPFPWFTVSEKTSREPVEEPIPPIDHDPRPVNLEISDKDIKVHIIESVKYESESHDLYIQRYEKVDYAEREKRFRRGIDW